MELLARIGLSAFLKPFKGTAMIIAIAALLALGTGIYGAWWGMKSNLYVAEAWRDHAVSLQDNLDKWELISKTDAEQALRDSRVISDAETILNGANNEKTDETNSSTWNNNDISLFKTIRNSKKH